jgi:hypothetical protein
LLEKLLVAGPKIKSLPGRWKFKKRNSSIYCPFLEPRVGENSRHFTSIFITPSIFGQPYG